VNYTIGKSNILNVEGFKKIYKILKYIMCNELRKKNIRKQIDKLLEEKGNDNIFIELLESNILSLEDTINLKKKTLVEREQRKIELDKQKQLFIEEFLDECNYYYLPDIDRFIVYKVHINDNNYQLQDICSISDEDSDLENYKKTELYSFELINENKIWIRISRKLKNYENLLIWKQKVRNEVISKLKKNNLLYYSIPESSTIQRVLSIFSSTITTNKELSKYLLTILGDALYKKHSDDIYFVNNDLYKALNVLQYNINKYCKCLFLSNFKTKYHNQNYDNIRYIKSNTNIDKTYIWEQLFKSHIFDIISVSCHYSSRFGSAENYLNEYCISISEIEHILYTKNRTKESIINEFDKEYLERNNVLTIKPKEVYYLWKDYLIEHNLPNTIYLNDLLGYLDEKYETKENVYIKLTSPKLKYIQKILDFVNEELIIIKEIDNEYDYEKETICESETIYTGKYNMLKFIEPDNYELGEIYQVFQHWKTINNKYVNINETIFLNVLKHFCDNILIEDNKYFYGVELRSWNKKNDVNIFLKENDKTKLKYSVYCNWCKNNNKKFIVSKSYFDFMKKHIL
jgi:hypothetical protein